jgi:arginyl-tRNA synthetase
MINIIEQMKQNIEHTLSGAIDKAIEKGQLPQIDIQDIFIETPREKGHGDFSTNIAMQITRQAKMPPAKIASVIIANINENLKIKEHKKI